MTEYIVLNSLPSNISEWIAKDSLNIMEIIDYLKVDIKGVDITRFELVVNTNPETEWTFLEAVYLNKTCYCCNDYYEICAQIKTIE